MIDTPMNQVNSYSAKISGLLVCAMMLLISADIIGRKIGHPVPGTTEIAGFALAWVIFLGLAPCEQSHGHIRVEFLITRLSGTLRNAMELVIYGMGFFIYAIMTWQTAIDALASWKIREAIPGMFLVPVYPAKTMVPIGCAFISVQLLLNTLDYIQENRHKAVLEGTALSKEE